MDTIYSLKGDSKPQEKNEKLLHEWEVELGYGEGAFSIDGIFPYYTVQETKILFIGRESLQNRGNIINYMYDAFRKGNTNGAKSGFTDIYKRLLQFSYGFLNGIQRYEDIPSAKELGGFVASKDNFSFAFINLSKITNPRTGGKYKLGPEFREFIKRNHKFIEDHPEGKNYWQEQIEILNPHIIIALGLEGFLNYDYDKHICAFGEMDVKLIGKDHFCNAAILTTKNGRKFFYIDPKYHFSFWNRSDSYFYEQIKECVDYALEHLDDLKKQDS